MNIIKTQEYFDLSLDELLISDNNTYTKEEKLLFDEGLKVIFFDDQKELEEENEEFNKWYKEYNYEVKEILETINGRIAVILI